MSKEKVIFFKGPLKPKKNSVLVGKWLDGYFGVARMPDSSVSPSFSFTLMHYEDFSSFRSPSLSNGAIFGLYLSSRDNDEDQPLESGMSLDEEVNNNPIYDQVHEEDTPPRTSTKSNKSTLSHRNIGLLPVKERFYCECFPVDELHKSEYEQLTKPLRPGMDVPQSVRAVLVLQLLSSGSLPAVPQPSPGKSSLKHFFFRNKSQHQPLFPPKTRGSPNSSPMVLSPATSLPLYIGFTKLESAKMWFTRVKQIFDTIPFPMPTEILEDMDDSYAVLPPRNTETKEAEQVNWKAVELPDSNEVNLQRLREAKLINPKASSVNARVSTQRFSARLLSTSSCDQSRMSFSFPYLNSTTVILIPPNGVRVEVHMEDGSPLQMDLLLSSIQRYSFLNDVVLFELEGRCPLSDGVELVLEIDNAEVFQRQFKLLLVDRNSAISVPTTPSANAPSTPFSSREPPKPQFSRSTALSVHQNDSIPSDSAEDNVYAEVGENQPPLVPDIAKRSAGASDSRRNDYVDAEDPYEEADK